ncbi:cyclic di-GMP phosphodiesterase Gmr [Noviherbaspirillum humi]|uniref:Cyclic di-GMP phosphodiesterase Gmr n=1 Tax=Noviherbaspirillum humi TaxID=1688639 RepID=A0A239IY49_9BURK|nr:cyclic di-GMP phosphodiesterase [Noviherbaspirillum humi]SNS97344.1 cyclic di-GMP phosphodiesterase Gmr [Noviherbaspirillum humi]
MNPADNLLYLQFGTTSPYWRLSADSDALHLSGDEKTTAVAVALSREQAHSIRSMTGVTSHRSLDLLVLGNRMRLHLVGRRTDTHSWVGTAADYQDTDAVARDLEQGLTFAEQVVSEVNSLVVIIDSRGKIKRFNRLCEELSGLKEENLLGLDAHELFMPASEHDAARANIRDFFSTKSSFEVIRPIRTQRGVRQVLWRNKLVRSGSGEEESFLVCSGTDITEELLAKEKLVQLANTDVLTGLPNRHAVQELIVAATQKEGAQFGLLFLDLDNFKTVNDHYGHIMGDTLIKAAADAVACCLGAEDTLARLGGDEFLVMVNSDSQAEVEAVAQRILDRMKVPFQLHPAEIYSSCSIGIAMYPAHGGSMEELVRSADMAMYAAKDGGRHTYRVFLPEMNRKVSEFVWLDTNMRRALEENQFELYYQPKQCLKTGRVESMEALIRWKSPERGMVMPSLFIPYAEESGLIIPLGKWVMETAARQVGEWRRQGVELRVAINVSARQLRHPTLIEDFRNALQAIGPGRSLLDIELTESCLIEDEVQALHLIRQFGELGAEVHLDDFGTGYSSLSQLARLPMDSLKLDRSFISTIHNDIRAQRLLRSMVAVAHELQLDIVAEGVETQEQVDFLRTIGVNHAQGYLFSKPMPAKDVPAWLASNGRLKAVA